MRPKDVKDLDVVSFFKLTINNRRANSLSCFNYENALRHLINFGGPEIKFESIKHSWIASLKLFLLNTSGFKCEKTLSSTSANNYLSIVLGVLKKAAEQRLIDPILFRDAKYVERPARRTQALSEYELECLVNSECESITVKRAFLLSCLTGLQWNEVYCLRWDHIENLNHESYQINLDEFNDARIVPLTSEAFTLLGSHKGSRQTVFESLKWNSYLYIKLNKWAIRAGILRNITFQTARATFAKLLSDQEIPVEIISELLGHRNVKSTVRLIGE